MRRIVYFVIVIFAVGLLSSCFRDTTHDAKVEFSQYYCENVIAINENSNLHFSGYSINFEKIVDGTEYIGGCIIHNNRVYFACSKQTAFKTFSLQVFSSDIHGENIKLELEKEGLDTKPQGVSCDNTFYIQYYINNTFNSEGKVIDSFNIVSYEYKNESVGIDTNLKEFATSGNDSNYICQLITENEISYFEILNNETNETKIVNDSFLQKTEYSVSLNKYKYTAKKSYILGDKIFFEYSIAAGNGWNTSHLIFEYDFKNDKIVYSGLFFTDDSSGIKLIRIS